MTKHVVIGLPEMVKPISQYIKLSEIDIPEDRARDLDMDWAQALAFMIAAQGLINPITVRMVNGIPRLVAGLHRYTAFGLLAVTINVNGLGAKAIVDRVGSALLSGDLIAGEVVSLVYDGTRFRTISRSEGSNQNIASAGWLKLPGGLIMQWGSFSGVTSNGPANGVYESTAITVTWPMAFPTAILQLVAGCGTDVSGVGLQEQAWFGSSGRVSGVALVACRQLSATLSGSYIAFGY